MFVFGVVLLLMGTLLTTLRVNYSQAGSLGSLPLLGVLAATIFSGPALDLLGARRVLVAGLILTALPMAAMPSLASFAGLAAAAFLYGVGGGVLNTATNAFVAELNVGGRASALNLLGFFFSLGAFSAPLLLTLLHGSTTACLYVLAAGTALILLPVLVLPFPAGARAGASLPELLRVLNRPLVWTFGLILLFESGTENSMFVWAGKLVEETLRVTPATGARALLALTAALGIGRLLASRLVKIVHERAAIMLACALMLAGATVAWAAPSLPGMIAGLALIGLGMSAVFPTVLGLAGDRFPRDTGTVFAAVMTVAVAGGSLGPKLSATLARGFGPLGVLIIPAVAAVVIAVITGVLTSKATIEE
jgi:FHS family glucose/mannose:H+ symporter-like MFS transporter